MARVLYGSEVTALKGSIGGTTFQRNNSGEIARLKPNRSKFNTVAQQLPIISFSYILSRWRLLTLTQQNEWNTFAASNDKTDYWGGTKILTGLNWFSSINSYRLQLGQSLLNSPPVFSATPPAEQFTLSVTTSSLKLLFDPMYDASGYWFFIFASSPLRQPSQANRRALRLIAMVEGEEFTEIDITSAWETYFGLTWPLSTSPGAYYIFSAVSQVVRATGLSSIYITDLASLV